jgi:hypothetical protein
VHSNDLTAEQRWPAWSTRVVEELGLRSVVSYPLFAAGDALGTLSLYSREPSAFSDEVISTEGSAFAAHVAVALAASQHIENLEVAVASRTVIGQATGIIMERFNLAPDLAFGVLTRLSSQSNRKVHQIATELVRTGVLPG